VALVAAVRAGNQEQQAFRMAIANTGNAAGVTVDQMNGMAEAMGEGFGKTAGKARDALTAMASTGQVARADLQQFAQVAIDVERVTGQSLEKTAENFAALGKDPLGASLRLSGSMNYLTVETYKQIKAAQELGNTQQAAAIAQQAYADAEEARITRAVEGVGYIERAWKAVTGAAVGAWNFMMETWDWLKSIGRDAPVQSQIADIRKELDLYDKGLRNLSDRQVQAYKDQLANLQEVERMSKRAGDAEAGRVATNTKGIKALIEEEKNASKVKAEADRKAREAADAAKEAAREAAKERQKEMDVGILRNKLVEENAKREIKLAQDTQKAYEDGLKPYLQAAKAAEDRVKSLEAEEAALQISESMNVSLAQAVEMVNIAKLKEQQIDAMGNEDAVAEIQKEIEAREKLVGLIGNKEGRDAASKAAKEAATEWQRASEKIQDSLTDALMRGFESGKGFAQTLKDTVINMFKTMVLRPVIQAVVGGVTGLGASGASAGGGVMDSLSNLRSIYSAGTAAASVGGQWLAGTMSSSNAAGTIGANMTGTGIDGLLASNGAYGTAGSSASTLGAGVTMLGGALVGFLAGKMISGGYSAIGKSGNAAVMAGTAIGAVVGGPIGAAIGGALGGLVNRAFGMGAKNTTAQGITGTFGAGSGSNVQAYESWFQKGGWFRSNKSGTNYSAVSSELDQFLDGAINQITNTTKLYATVLGLSADAVSGFTKSINISLIGLDAAGKEKAITDALVGFGNSMAEVLLSAASPFARAGESAGETLSRLSTSLISVNGVLNTLNQTLLDSTLASGDAASKLLDLFGGLENFNASTGAYYQAYYTEAERNAKITETLTKTMQSMGLTLPKNLQGFRQLVEVQDLNTDVGRQTYVALMALAPAFAQVATAAADAQGSLQAYQNAFYSPDEIKAGQLDRIKSAFDAIGLQVLDGVKTITEQRFVGFKSKSLFGGGMFRPVFESFEREVPNLISASLPTTLDGYRKLVEAQDQATDAGKRAYAMLIELGPQFAEYAKAQQEVENQRIEAMTQATESVIEEIRRLRGLGQAYGGAGSLQAQFAILTAQAKAGDSAALGRLPEITRAIEEAALTSAKTSRELAYTRAMLAVSLSDTVTSLGGMVPAFAAGGLHSGGLRLVGENGPELEITGPARYYSAAETSSMMGGGMVDELRGLREEVAMLRAEARATAINTGRTQDIMKRITKNGESMIVSTDGEALEVTAP
jgi:hypothetical protein